MKKYIELYLKELKSLRFFFTLMVLGVICIKMSMLVNSMIFHKRVYLVLYLIIPFSWLLFPVELESLYKREKLSTTYTLFTLPIHRFYVQLGKFLAVLTLFFFYFCIIKLLHVFTINTLNKFEVITLWDLSVKNFIQIYSSMNYSLLILSFALLFLVCFIESIGYKFKRYRKLICSIIAVCNIVGMFWLFLLLQYQIRYLPVRMAVYCCLWGSFFVGIGLVLFEKYGEV